MLRDRCLVIARYRPTHAGVKMDPVKRRICRIRRNSAMDSSRPENQRVSLLKGKNRGLLSQNQGAGSHENEFVRIDDPLRMDSMTRRNKEARIARFKPGVVRNRQTIVSKKIVSLRDHKAAGYCRFPTYWNRSSFPRCSKYWPVAAGL